MANEIKYQINGQLADNTVTVDNKEDMILVPVSIGSADENRIIAELKAEDSGLREETIRHVFDLQKRAIKRLLMTGMSVNTGLYYAAVSFRGVVENSTWNPAKNSIVVNFNVGADLREAIKQTTVGIIGEKGSAMYIGSVQDAATRAQDASATAGRAFTLAGGKLKVMGNNPAVGITLTDSKGTETKVTEDLWVTNDPSKLTFIIPAGLANGTYELKVTTQFGSNSKTLLKAPRSVVKTIYIGTAPSGGGSGSGPDGDLDENPMG
ncbi:MAG: DUF4469 domain-containing protein [Bacteroides sp.]|nr:DUF4469 domain-containing protein [Bacteroides sp.]